MTVLTSSAGSTGGLFTNIQQSALFTFNENALLRNLVTQYDLTGTPGLTAQVPVYPTSSAAHTALTETSDLTSTETITPTSVTITAAEYGQRADITDLMLEASPFDVATDVGRILGDALAQGMDEKITDAFANFSGEAGPGAGAELKASHIINAAATLRAASAPVNYVAVIHPLQAASVKATLANAGGTLSNAEVANEAMRSYFVGAINGVRIFESASIDIDGSGDAVGAVFHPMALGMVMKRNLRIATQRDESARATEIIATAAYGVAELKDAYGVKLTADATV